MLIKIREGKLAGCSLVSIHGIPALEGVRMEADGTIVIGPATTFSHITYDSVIQKYIPALGWAVDQVGGPQIRNIGTIGGHVCNGVTSADSAALLFTLNAVLELTGPKGTREIPVAEFYTGPGRTLREHAEILTAIKITRENYRGFYGHYTKYGKRNAMEIATLGCAVHVKLSADNMRISEFRLGFGVAAPTPIRCFKTEETVKGMAVTDPELYEKIQEGAVSEVTPRSSWRASREFRLQLVRELSVRTAKEAIEKASGGEADA